MNADISIDSRAQTMHGVAFPLSAEAHDGLSRFQKKQCCYIQLVSTTLGSVFVSSFLPLRPSSSSALHAKLGHNVTSLGVRSHVSLWLCGRLVEP